MKLPELSIHPSILKILNTLSEAPGKGFLLTKPTIQAVKVGLVG